MKGPMMIALAFGMIAAATPAMADQVVVQRTTTTVHHDSSWHAAPAHHKQRVCRSQWDNHHHRVRHCYWR